VVARLHLTEALRTLGQLHESYSTLFGLEGIAAVLVAEGHFEKALCLAGAAAELRIATGVAALPIHAADLDRRLEPARAALGSAEADAAALSGRELTRAQAIAHALSSDDSAITAPVGNASLLTTREREVAALVGRGFTNRQIAEALVITAGTAGLHVQHIFDKLGVHNRTRLATWALSNGLDVSRSR
jgi:non-specific serine/threonine protein kinase